MNTIHLDELECLYGVAPAKETVQTESSQTTTHHRASPKKKSFVLPNIGNIHIISELKTLVIIFVIVFSAFFFFTNAKLVFFTINDTFSPEEVKPLVATIEEPQHNAAESFEEKQGKIEELEEKFSLLQQQQKAEKEIAVSMKDFLDKKQETHSLNFNILPPTNRLIIPDLNINVPLIDVPSKGKTDFAEGKFDDELMQGVVKYPTTATPGSKGNSLLFGHSSTEWWKHNEYGFVFRNLPKLKVGQKFQVIRNGQLTNYEMVERKVLLPNHVADYYHEFQDKGESFVTLMGCYPIGSDAKRMLVVAKKVEA